jgi:peptidoglycan/LPS O-acetylase OafA/YrhL
MARTSRPRLHALDGLRGLAALAVVVLHVWMYTDAFYPKPGRIHAWPPEALWTLPSYLGAFAAGIAAAMVKPKRGLTPFMFVVFGTVLVVANGWWHSRGGTGTPGHAIGDLPAAIGFGAIVAAIAARPGRLLASPPMRALGTLSFGIYLWHMPVVYGLKLHDRFPERFVPAMGWVLPLTFALATASWFLIEKPAIALSGRALAKRSPAREPLGAEA